MGTLQEGDIVERPTVFVSSTVLDFHDLRGALKYLLESLGYRVLMSEFADFPAEANKSTYEACFSAIDEADVFVLLVGRRVGAWKEVGRLSVTHAEYRHARKRVTAGELSRMLIFVRKEVWDIKHDRDSMDRELRRYACVDRETPASVGADDHGPTELDIHSLHGDIGQNATYIFQFLKEICQEEEQTRAAQEGAGYPKANWVRPFSVFEEIVAGIGSAIDMRRSVRQQQLDCLLIDELRRNQDLIPGEEELLSTLDGALKTKHKYDPTQYDSWYGRSLKLSRADGGLVKRLFIDFVDLRSSTIIREALVSGEFLTLTPGRTSYEVAGLASTLRELLKKLHALEYIGVSQSFFNSLQAFNQIHSASANDPTGTLVLPSPLPVAVGLCFTMLRCIRNLHQEALDTLLRASQG